MSPHCSISFEKWLTHFKAHQECLRICSDDHQAEQGMCPVAFPVPPNDNIEPHLECLGFALLNHNFCIERCRMDFRAAVCFEGQPDDPGSSSSSLGDDVQDVKDAARNAANTMLVVGVAVGLGGGLMRVASKMPSLGANASKALDSGGLFAAAGGVGIAGIGAYARLTANDPPDPQFDEMARLRKVTPDAFLPSGFRGLPFSSIFAPIVFEYLKSFLYLEAFLLSLEKSAGAREGGNTDKELAHIRVAREYARGFAESLAKAGAARAEAAVKLENVLGEARDSGNGDRIIIDLANPGAPDNPMLVQPFSRARQAVILGLQDAINLHLEWTSGALDDTVSHAIDALASDKQGRSDYLATINEFAPSSEFFGRSPSALLTHPAFGAIESPLVTSFGQFAQF